MTIIKKLSSFALGLGLVYGGLEARADPINSVTLNPVTNNANITWLWTTQNLVQATSSGNGYATATGVNPESYVEQGSNVTLTAIASNGYTFANWGGIPAAYTNENPATFSVDKPYTAVANFVENTHPTNTFRGTIFTFCMNHQKEEPRYTKKKERAHNYSLLF